MPPILHLMRHGQGYHSSEVTPKDGHLLHDPSLTPKGIAQCQSRRDAFDRHSQIELLLASPLRRAIQTTTHAFAPCIARGLKIIALPAAEEVSSDPCDTGSSTATLRKEFGDDLVDFSHLSTSAGGDEGWFEHVGDYSSEAEKVHARAETLRRWIRERKEKEVVLVSHGYFAHYLTHEVDKDGQQTTPWWGEAELRSYRFEEVGESAVLVELRESVERRGVDGEKTGEKRVLLNLPGSKGLVIH
jgi:broad specificity phosphatase PhoE